MNKFLSFVLILMLSISSILTASGEECALTSDEQAYDIFLDLQYACNNVIEYMVEMERLWQEANSLRSLDSVNGTWFQKYVNDTQREALILTALEWEWSTSAVQSALFGEGFVGAFKSVLNQYPQEKTNLVWAGLEFFTVMGALDDITIASAYLDDAKNGIRALTAQDKDYAFLPELKSYYKEAAYMYQYVVDFNDNLAGLTANRGTFEKTQHSFAIDFEFIFDPVDFKSVESRWQSNYSLRWRDSRNSLKNVRDALEVIARRKTMAPWNTGVSSVRGFHNGLAMVKMNGKYGFMNLEGKLVVPCTYDYAFDFVDGVAIVEKNGKCGVIDTTGKLVSNCQWSRYPFEISEGLIQVNNGSSNGFIDANGKQVIPCAWGSCSSFSEGLAYVTNKSTLKGVYIDKNGKTVLTGNWSGGSKFSEGLAAVKNDKGKWGFIDKKGNLVIPYKWDSADGFYGGIARVGINKNPQQPWGEKKYGFISTTGEVIVPCGTYDMAWYFQDEYTAVKQNGKWGFIDTTGKLIIPCKYNTADYVYDGFAVVSKNGKYGLVDITGKLVVDCVWDTAWWCRGYLHVEKNGKCGMTDTAGNVVIPCEYESTYYGEGYFTLVKNGEVYIYDENMNQIL